MVVNRVTELEPLVEATKDYPAYLDIESWLGNENNIALGDEVGSVALFEYEYPGLYTGHYFFSKDTRGRRAKDLATEMIRDMFVNRGARSLRGLTPLTNQAARWMTRKLGFLSMGVIETTVGPCELFVLTPDRFYQTLNEKAQ